MSRTVKVTATGLVFLALVVSGARAAECRYFQGASPVEDEAQPTAPTGAYAQMVGSPLGDMRIHRADGVDEVCPAHFTDTGNYVQCKDDPDPVRFALFGSTINTSLGDDILVMWNTPWYREPGCPADLALHLPKAPFFTPLK